MEAIQLVHRVELSIESPASVAYHNRGIWVADVEKGLHYLVDYKTADICEQMKSIAPRPQTISWDGHCLWEYDEETSVLYKHGFEGRPSYRFGLVEGINTPYYGFSYRDKTLWIITPDQPEFTVSNNQIFVIEFPRNIRSETFEAPTHSCRGLSHDGKYLWTLDVEACEVFCIDPRRGSIITSYFLPECNSPSSLIVTDDKIWTLNLKTNELLTYSLDRSVKYSILKKRRSQVEIVYTARNNGTGTVNKIKLYNSMPQKYYNQVLLKESIIEPPPVSILKSQWDDHFTGSVVVHEIGPLATGQEKTLTFGFDIETKEIKYHLFPDRIGNLEDVSPEIRKNFLLSEMMKDAEPLQKEIIERAQLLFQTGEREIREKVEEIIGGEKNTFWIARLLYNFVIDTVKYILPYASLSSRKILKQGKGSCGNHATVYIALCQVAGLPSRSIIGFSIWKDDSRLGYLDHEIPEVYMPGYGWIPADTSRFMSLPIYGTHPLTKFRSFGTLSDRFFVNGFGRDLKSEFAHIRHQEENLAEVEGPAAPELRFFMRWSSS